MSSFSKKRYREIVADLFEPNLNIFWRDFLFAFTLFIAGLAALYVDMIYVQVAGFVLAVIMAYRCASYVHEVVHLPKTTFGNFIKAWNMMIGVPFLMPSVMYESHLDHHIPRKYGTEQDPEYLPLKGSSVFGIIGFILHHALLTPLILFLRFTLGLPARLLSKKLAKHLESRVSSLVINWDYERSFGNRRRLLLFMEIYMLTVNIVGGILLAKGILTPIMILKPVSVILSALVLNGARTLAAHQYHNMELKPVNSEEQLLDSLNYGGPRWIGLLMAPVGLRYHALHHLFATIPYHNLETAHNRLMNQLPDDDVYKQTEFKSFLRQLHTLTQKAEPPKQTPAADAA